MPAALLVPTWVNPYAASAYTGLYAVISSFKIEPATQRYFVHVVVFVSQAAYLAGKAPVADRVYVSGAPDGVFPEYSTIIGNSAFSTPLVGLRDWILNTIKSSDPLFAGSTDL